MKWTTAESLAGEWASDMGFSGKQNEELFYRWIHNATEQIVGTELLVFNLAFLDVKNGTAELPENLHTIYLVACTDNPARYWNRGGMKKWVDKSFGKDCQLEVKLKCGRCQEEHCKCSTAVLEFEIDQIYREENPWIWHNNFSHFVGYNAPTMDGFPVSNLDAAFHLMKPKTSNDVFWNSEYYLGICSKLGDVCRYTYSIEDKFITDLNEGQVLISYTGRKMDSQGYYMIPDQAEVVEAIESYITERLTHRKWMMGDGNQTDRLRWIDAGKKRDELMARATSALEVPDAAVWERLVDRHVKINRDQYHYGYTG